MKASALDHSWNSFIQNSAATVGCWELEPQQVNIINSWLAQKSVVLQQTPVVFFPFESACIDPLLYGTQLYGEMIGLLTNPTHDALLAEADKSLVDFKLEELKPGVDAWLSLLSTYRQLILPQDAIVVAYLKRSSLTDVQQWREWVQRFVVDTAPSWLRLMLVDNFRNPAFGDFAKELPDHFALLEVPTEQEDTGKPKIRLIPRTPMPAGTPEEAFHAAYGSMMKQKDMWKAADHGDQAIQIARKHDWHHLEISTLLGMANVFSRHKRFRESLEKIDEALKLTNKIEADNPELSKRMRIQVLLAEGDELKKRRNLAAAAESYETAAREAETLHDQALIHQAWYGAGDCWSKTPRRAWDCYLKAYEAGKQLPEELIGYSSLAKTAHALLLLTRKTGNRHEEPRIEGEMARLFGVDWEREL